MFLTSFKSLSAALVATLALATAAPQVHADDNVDRTTDLYKRFTYKNVTSEEAGRIFSSLGIQSSFNPKNKMKNPDPAWIPGWDSLSLTDESQTAIVQAAVNRTWTAQVHKDYQRYRAAWAAIEQTFRPELDRAKTGTYHQRADALAALYEAVRKQADADKVLYSDSMAPGNVGFINDIVLAMVELHRETKREFLLDNYIKHRNITIDKLAANARPFAPDDVERELFTAFTQDNGNYDTQKLPMMSGYGKAHAAVKWPTVKSAAEAKKVAAKLVETNKAALAFTDVNVPSLFSGGTPVADDAKLVYVDPPINAATGYDPLVVKKVGKTLTLETVLNKSDPYGCKVNPLNTMETYGCKYKRSSVKYTFEVTPTDLPDGVEIQKGDVIGFYADLESKKESKKGNAYVLTMRAIETVKRGNQAIWPKK